MVLPSRVASRLKLRFTLRPYGTRFTGPEFSTHIPSLRDEFSVEKTNQNRSLVDEISINKKQFQNPSRMGRNLGRKNEIKKTCPVGTKHRIDWELITVDLKSTGLE